MDAAHMHMEIENRQADADEVYHQCVGVLRAYGALPGMVNDPGERPELDLAKALGEMVKYVIREAARLEYRLDFEADTLTATLYSVFIGHIPDEALGDQFYRSTRERYLG